MKKIVLLFFLLFFFFPHPVFANGAGLPPFLKINEKYPVSNPLQQYGITASSFLLPQDLAIETYLVNQPIHFQITPDSLQAILPANVIDNIKYVWDFGDGVKTDGLDNTHTYTKIGSYILIVTLNIYTPDSPSPTQFVDSFLLHIVPVENYKDLPRAVINVNGKEVTDPLNNKLDINFTNVTFDAKSSHAASPIVEYLWNFGDGQTGAKPVVTHTYNEDQVFETVVLRVKDKNGFISDAFVGIKRADDSNNVKSIGGFPLSTKILIGLLVAVIVLIIFTTKYRRH